MVLSQMRTGSQIAFYRFNLETCHVDITPLETVVQFRIVLTMTVLLGDTGDY